MESLVRGVILARSLAASERCFVAAARALPSAVSSVPCFFLMAAILSRYSFSDIASLSDPGAMARDCRSVRRLCLPTRGHVVGLLPICCPVCRWGTAWPRRVRPAGAGDQGVRGGGGEGI